MKMRYGKRQAVAPVLATLLMIAVAVAMSVIIFMWSQGFLSQTSSATGGQQGAQNQAAQSSIAIETATFVTGTATDACGTGVTAPCTQLIIRNVGAVAVNLGSVLAQGGSSNAGFKTSVVVTFTTTPVTCTSTIIVAVSGGSSPTAAKGASCSLGLTGLTSLASGDVVNVKVTTTVGTFASAQFTVP